jgi:hypothetical protein
LAHPTEIEGNGHNEVARIRWKHQRPPPSAEVSRYVEAVLGPPRQHRDIGQLAEALGPGPPFPEPVHSLSDVGCTFRVISREHVQEILDRSTLPGSAYGLEMLLISVVTRAKMVQIPLNYHPRVGQSSVTGDFGKTVSLGLEMIGLVIKTGLKTISRRPRRVATPTTV